MNERAMHTPSSTSVPLLRRIAVALAWDAIFCTLLYLWLGRGIDGAGNVYQVAFWVLMPLGVVGLLSAQVRAAQAALPRGFRNWRRCMQLLYYGVLAFHGQTLMAAAQLIAFFAGLIAVEGEKKRSKS